MKTAALLVRVALIGLVGSAVSVSLPAVWFWGSGSAESLAAIASHKASLGGAEIYYSIGAGSVNDTSAGFTAGGNRTLIASMKASGIKVHAIVGCGSIATLRRVFQSPTPFIEEAVAAAIEFGLDGFNLDFEPYSLGGGRVGVTNADGLAYALFLTKFADALHLKGLELSLDYFSNLAIWNLGAINGSTVDTVISMDTYAQDNTTMEAYTEVALGYLNSARLGVGVCPQPSATRKPYGPDPCGPLVWTPAMIAERLGYMRGLMTDDATAFRMMNFCCTGMISDDWWAGLKMFYASF